MDTVAPQPPRLLLGASLLLWGGMREHPFIGLLLALVVEAAHWTQTRWAFGNTALQRAWQLSVALLLFTAVLIWLGGDLIDALPRAFGWLPVILLPLQFVQSYGIHRSISLTAFSHFLRKKREHAVRYGLPFREVRFSFSHVYFLAVILAASLGREARGPVFYPAAILLILWAVLHPLLRRPRIDLVGPFIVLPLAIYVGLHGERIIDKLTENYVRSSRRHVRGDYDREKRAAIGSLRDVKLSPDIRWRLIPVQGELPSLLRVASYNHYRGTQWSALQPADIIAGSEGFSELDSYGLENPYRVTARADAEDFIDGEEASAEALPRCILRGALEGGMELLPIPGNTASLIQPAQNLEINGLGTLRIDPRHPVADSLIVSGHGFTTARPPWENPIEEIAGSPSLSVPEPERPALRALIDQLDLHDLGFEEKILRLREHFLRNFTYTKYDSAEIPLGHIRRARFISDFLTEQKKGHCEYFATAAVLLLREAGIPARYATGFALIEHDKEGVALIRGNHAHAWALAWDERRGTWVDVDLTPPDWTKFETPRAPRWQPFLDRLRIFRDDFLVWRTQPGNLALVIVLMSLPLAGGGWFIGKRLWTSRRNVGSDEGGRLIFQRPASPLERLEKAARRHLGHRPGSVPLAQWLAPLRDRLATPADLDRALHLHRQLRFDPLSNPSDLLIELEEIARRLGQQLRRMS